MNIKLLDCFTEKQPYLNKWEIGERDLKLMLSLIKAGPEHRKFLRMVISFNPNLFWSAESDINYFERKYLKVDKTEILWAGE